MESEMSFKDGNMQRIEEANLLRAQGLKKLKIASEKLGLGVKAGLTM